MRRPAALALLALLLTPLLTILARPPAASQAQSAFADPAFLQLWDRVDSLVAANLVTNRSWYWGPGPGRAGMEPYAEAPSGLRVVQYFDKARMEINQPFGDRSSPWFVTTGLLVRDMVAGRQQVGDNSFLEKGPAQIVVAGDHNDPRAPTYASFRTVTSLNDDHRATKQIGARVTSTINRAGQVGVDSTKATDVGARIEAYSDVFGHNIPNAIWQYLNQAGTVRNGLDMTVERPVMNWIFVVGYPISEPFWARVQAAGKPTDVLIQLFERRVLIYIPSYREPWDVQMANVGLHYYDWVYGKDGAPPPVNVTPVAPRSPTATPTREPTRIPPPPTFVLPTAPPLPTATRPPVPPTVPPAPPTAPPPTSTPVPPAQPTATATFPPSVPPGLDASVSPQQGTAGTIFNATATGFQANERVSAWLTSPNSQVTALTEERQADGSGQVAGIAINSSGFADGIWALTVAGVTSKHQSVAYFRVGTPPPPSPPPALTNTPVPGATNPPAPTGSPIPATTLTPPAGTGLTITPSEGTADTTFTFVATGLTPNETLEIRFVDPRNVEWRPATGSNITANAAGQFYAQIKPSAIFSEVPKGVWTFYLLGKSSGLNLSATMTIR